MLTKVCILKAMAFPRSGVAAVRRYPTSRAKEKPQQDGRRADLHLESNSISVGEAKRAQTNLVHTRTQGPHRD